MKFRTLGTETDAWAAARPCWAPDGLPRRSWGRFPWTWRAAQDLWWPSAIDWLLLLRGSDGRPGSGAVASVQRSFLQSNLSSSKVQRFVHLYSLSKIQSYIQSIHQTRASISFVETSDHSLFLWRIKRCSKGSTGTRPGRHAARSVGSPAWLTAPKRSKDIRRTIRG